MFKNKFFVAFLFLAVLALVFYSLSGSQTDEPTAEQSGAYINSIVSVRKDKDTFLKTNKESPIEDKANFKGLKYFDIDPAYKVSAKLDILTSEQTIKIAMTGGETEEYEAYANISFEVAGQKCALKLFKTPEGNLFLPFRDLTTNKETYGSGRYLDLSIDAIKDQHIDVDFNLAYQPYCTYNHTFTCPVPPAENFLNVTIKAGERL